MITFTLYLWTVVAAGSSGRLYQDWRPIGEFHYPYGVPLTDAIVQTAKDKCEAAARELGLTTERYRCIRSR